MISASVRGALARLGLTPYARRLYVLVAADERTLSIDGTDAGFGCESFGDHMELNRVGAEREVLRRLRREIRPSDVFLDIGSNLGVFAVFVGSVIEEGAVVAVEPVPATADKLRRNLARNGIDATVANVAFAAEAGEVRMTVPDAHGSSAVESGETESEVVTVESVPGDEHLEARDLPTPTVVKMDVEGYEHAALNGLEQTLGSPDCRLVYCEVHPGHASKYGIDSGNVEAILGSHGFETDRIADLPGERYVLRASRRD